MRTEQLFLCEMPKMSLGFCRSLKIINDEWISTLAIKWRQKFHLNHDGEKKVVLVTHDESSFEAHDGKRFTWLESEKNLLRPKGSGRSIMVSQFLCQCHGAIEITLTDQLIQKYPNLCGVPGDKVESLRSIKPGKNADGYWTNKDLVEQVQVTQTLFEILHPNCVALFAFDNSQNHRAMAPNALVAKRLNLADGGSKVPPFSHVWNF